MRTSKNVLCASLVVVGSLALASTASAYPLNWSGGASTSDYNTAGNWYSAHYDASYLPGAGDSVTIDDSIIASPTVVLSSGSSTVFDFSAFANSPSGQGGDTTFTMLSGTSLISSNNFDLGYYNGSGTTTININQGAAVTVTGYFGGGRAGPHTTHLYGTLDAGTLEIGGADYVDLGSSGVITGGGNDLNALNTSWITQGLFTAAPGYKVVGTYDGTSDRTTISTAPVPEPATGALILIGLGGLMMRRRKYETV
jgi:hypothetical protein